MRAGPLVAVAVAAMAAVAGCAASGGDDSAGVARAAGTPGARVLADARRRAPSAAAFARARGARVAVTRDGRSYYVLWPGARRGGRVIVTMHGYLSTAFDDFKHWYPVASARGYEVLAIQWRLGPRASQSSSPSGIYAQVRDALRGAGVGRGQALLHAYSSAAYRVYGVAALDRRSAGLFGLDVAAAGGARPRFSPLYRQVFGGGWGPRSLAGSNWVLFCGGRDPYPDATGCRAMRRTRDLIRRRGGTVERLIVDPRANHGGFLKDRHHVNAALDVFERVSPQRGT
jgi:hypothetical protein